MTRTRIGAALALLALALLTLPAGARGDSSNPTWAGTWDTDFGKMTLDAGGSGNYVSPFGAGSSGSISGNVDGRVNKGEWKQPSSSGKFIFTMSSNGLFFTGDWEYDSGGCGSSCGWNGECKEGACLENDDPPPVEPRPCGGAAMHAFVAVTQCDLSKLPFGPEWSVPGPGRGETVDISPKPIKANVYEIYVALRELALEEEAKNEAKNAIAIAAALKTFEFGQDVGACVILFTEGTKEVVINVNSTKFLATVDACKRVAAGTVPKQAGAGTAATGCRTAVIPIVRKDKATKRRRAQIVAAAKRKLDFSCKRRAGRLRGSIKTSQNGKPLSSVIERRIRAGAGRQLPAGETSNARLGVRWTARRP